MALRYSAQDLRLTHKLVWDGPIKALFRSFNQDLKIERLEIVNDEFTEFLSRRLLTSTLNRQPISSGAKRSQLVDLNHTGDRGNTDHGDAKISLPESDINEMGLPTYLMSFLEVFKPIKLH
jgi:LIM-domain binding protein